MTVELVQFLAATILLSNIRSVSLCGCYGATSCTSQQIQCGYPSNDSCRCDCCPPCNTCLQLLESNCLAHRYVTHYRMALSNHSHIIAKVYQPISPSYIIDELNGNPVRYLWDPCFRSPLPNGLNLTVETVGNNSGVYKLIGTPTEQLEKTYFEILFKGPVSIIALVNFTISII